MLLERSFDGESLLDFDKLGPFFRFFDDCFMNFQVGGLSF